MVSSTSAPPPSNAASSETLDVGGWQVVVTDGHAVLPKGMTHLPDGTFQLRTSLVSVAFPRSLASIGDGAFYRCTSLVSVDLPASLTSIRPHAFRGCSSLAHVAFPAGLTSIGDNAYNGCTSLASVTFPAGLTSIGVYAFCACPSMTRVTVPTTLTSIGHGAFRDCPLTRVTVPDTATVGYAAFPPATTVLRLPPKRMRDLQRWYEAVAGALAYKRCRPGLVLWLERANIRLGSYGPGGAARQRDLEEFEGDFAPLVE